MYALMRDALFALDTETAHHVALSNLARLPSVGRGLYGRQVAHAPIDLMGLQLPNPIGLAAGLDKDGRYIDGLAGLGFGFLEIGTVTPRAQAGNARPRLFRLTQERALLNRMGFNNDGVEALVDRVSKRRSTTALGINIGKNAETPEARTGDDYVAALAAVYEHAAYVTINISSPNTQGLRDMQGGSRLDGLLAQVCDERDRLAEWHDRYVPMAVKIAPDLDEAELDSIADRLGHHAVDGVIATNTTTSRRGLAPRWWQERGGVSGVPVRESATEVIRGLRSRLGPQVPIIGVGGIQSARDARDKLEAGANALQLYTGLVYEGPSLVADCARAAALELASRRASALKDVVGRDRARAAAANRSDPR